MSLNDADVFLSHAAADKPLVKRIAGRLVEAGITPWLDEWNLIPGALWQPAIESALATCRSVAVFVGPAGIAPWHHQEMRSAIARRVSDERFRVIPVLLPGGSRDAQLPPFLTNATWVDYSNLEDDEALRLLICGIQGVVPGPRVHGLPSRANRDQASAPAGRILAVSHHVGFLAAAGRHLAGAGHQLRLIGDPRRLPEEVRAFRPDLIVAQFEGRWGVSVLGRKGIREVIELDAAGTPVALVLDDRNAGELVRAFREGVVDVLHGPFGGAHLARVDALLEDLTGRTRLQPEHRVVHDFLAFARRCRLNGALFANRGLRGEGRASFTGGVLEEARYGAATGIDALREMLRPGQQAFDLEVEVEGHAAAPVEAGAAGLVKPRVLVVDDEPDMLLVLTKHLQRGAGFDVAGAADGMEAVEAAVGAATAAPFDAIVADLSMPRMDGWAMIRVLKADPRTRETPIIVLSAHDDYRESLKAANVGACDYLAKTGRPEPIVYSVTSAAAPRLEVAAHLVARRPVEIEIDRIGVRWLVLTLGRLGATGVLELRDTWGSYRLRVVDGVPVAAAAEVKRRELDGRPAVEALLASKSAKGSFVSGAGDREEHPALAASMREMLESIDAQEAAASEVGAPLTGAFEFYVDEGLYQLFCRMAPPRQAAFAQVLHEQDDRVVDLVALADRLQLPLSSVSSWVEELLSRGVITPRQLQRAGGAGSHS